MSSGEKPSGRSVPRPLSGGPTRFGPFMLEARLAVGGTAEVYVARPIDPLAEPRRLVVKRLLPQFLSDPEGRTMFEREAALHAAIHHDNVVRVFGSGVVGDEPWLAMELVEGCDLFRLLRRTSSEGRSLGAALSAHIARQILGALQSVHTACDAQGAPLGIIHRDVTPSNVYLSTTGGVKLGDFGIARAMSRPTLRSTGSDMLKGKFAYLAPEQVASEPFDHRADLFAMGAVISEMLLGRPLFAGSGQLAVLLAIRDCRIEPLREARHAFPAGLFEVLERALARDPAARFPSAAALSDALAPFDVSPAASRSELAVLVRFVQTAPSSGQMQAVRDSARKLRAAATGATGPAADEIPPARDSERTTGEYVAIPSHVFKGSGARRGPWSFARLVEAMATGEVGRGDMVDYMGRGPQPIESIDELARFLPALTSRTTDRVAGVSAADFADAVSETALVRVLIHVLRTQGTGVLFAEGPTESRRLLTTEGTTGRKELYFVGGKLHHVASNNASELLGEYLARRRVISRDELDFALAVLPRYGGRMGDTLIALGLVGSLDIFRAIRDQGRDRLIDLFQWPVGTLAYYSGQTAPHVEFPLELELPSLILAGVEAAQPGEIPLTRWRDLLDSTLAPGDAQASSLRAAPWPIAARRALEAVDRPLSVRALLATLAHDPATRSPGEILRAVDVLLLARLLTLSPA
jgi:serine/threonine-protein kinase